MEGKGLKRLGDFLPEESAPFTNRTGATLALGQLAMVDLLGTEAESTSIERGNSASGFANLTAITQAGYDAGFPIVACMEPAGVADNKPGTFLICGVQDISVLDDDVSTTDTDKGDALRVLVSESAISTQALATDTQRSIGIALQDGAATSADTDRLIDASSHRRRVWFFGGLPCCQQSA